MNKLSNNYVPFLFILLGILVFFPVVHTGFTTNDDTKIAIDGFNILSRAARDQGRIGTLCLLYVANLPYVIDSDIYFQMIRLSSVLLSMSLFSFCVYYLLNSFSIALLSGIFWLGFLQITWDHNLITSYPVVLQIPLQFLFLSLIFFKKYVSEKHLRNAIFAAFCYFCAMFYEAFVLYFPLFLIIQWQHSEKTDKIILRVRNVVYGTAPIIIAVVLYLILYAGWRWLHPSTYSGTSLYFESFARAFLTIIQFSISSLPGYYYFSGFDSHIFYGFHHPFSIPGFIDQLRVEWIVKACSLFWATIILLYRAADEKLRKSTLMLYFVVCIIAIFLPNILLGFSSKYQHWVFSWERKGYVTTYYSFFATSCALTLLVTYMLQYIKRRPLIKASFVLIFAITVSFFSFITDYYNFFITQDQKLSQIKWKVVDRFLKTPQFEMIPEGSVIYAPTLYEHRGIVENDPGYWSRYIRMKTGKPVDVTQHLPESTNRSTDGVFFLKFFQEAHTENQFLVFAKMDRIPIANSATIFFYSNNKILELLGILKDKGVGGDGQVFINDLSIKKLNAGTFTARIDLRDAKNDFPFITIKSNKLIDLNEFYVSYFYNSHDFIDSVLVFGSGWSGDEGSHRWANSKSAEIVILNNQDGRISINIGFFFISFKPQTIKMALNSTVIREVKVPAGKSNRITLPSLTLKPGENILRFETDVSPALPGNGDPRLLSFGITGLEYNFK